VWLGRAQPGMCSDLDSICAARAHARRSTAACLQRLRLRRRLHLSATAPADRRYLVRRAPAALQQATARLVQAVPDLDRRVADRCALVGVGGEDEDNDRALPLDALRRRDPIAGKPDTADRLHELRGLACAALETMPPGALVATPFRRAGLTAAMCQEARKLEWSTKVEPDDDQPIERADLNLDLAGRARFRWAGGITRS